jgi:hypothetical protein
MQNSFALDAEAETAARSLVGTRPCHLVLHNRLHPIIECPSVAAVIDENVLLAAAERLSISNYVRVPPKRDPPVRYSYLPPHLHINQNQPLKNVAINDLKLECP